MNVQRRKALAALSEKLEEVRTMVTEIGNAIDAERDAEQEFYDNMPEGIQSGDKGTRAEEVVNHLDDAITELSGIDGTIGDVIQSLEDAAA